MYFKEQGFILTMFPFGFASVFLFKWFDCRAVVDEGDVIVIKLLVM